MAEAFSVDPESLSNALERMDTFQRMSAALLGEIDSVVKNLHMSWDGAGASAHVQAHRKWSYGAAHQSGKSAHQNYTRAAATNRGMWS